MWNDLSLEVQKALEEKAKNDGIELTEELKEVMAKKYIETTSEIGSVVNSTLNGNLVSTVTISQFIENTIMIDYANQILSDIIDLSNEVNEDLVIINYNAVCSPLCRNAQNKIYSISGESDKYPKLDNYTFKNNGWQNGKALFHKNCKHWLSIYYEGESDKPQKELPKKVEKQLYHDQQKVQYYRKNYEKYQQRLNINQATGIYKDSDSALAQKWALMHENEKRIFEKKYKDLIS